jgi:FlaA1/EpsC-like NDP-sugar epimerase
VQFAAFLASADKSQRTDVGGFFAHRRLLGEVIVDCAVVVASLLTAYALVVTGTGTDDQQTAIKRVVPAVLAARLAAFLVLGLYRAVWRYAGLGDAARVAAAVLASEAVAAAFVLGTRNVGALGLPLSVFVVDALLCAALVAASRFGERALIRALSLLRRQDETRTLIVGAGRVGRSLLRELRETPGERVIGFVDDDASLRRRRLQGVPVLGGVDALASIIARTKPDSVLVTIPDAPRDRLDVLVRACADADVACRFVRRERDLDPKVVLGAAAE